ncbi:FAD-binding oxidoreductase [Amylibacter sp.]|jgi:sarcosine oxidase|nr:FAD-binding oxidoreductase [Amylibacter sp.]
MYDVIVIGAGMMGSAAARHLADMGAKTLLVGPNEPGCKETHTGVFASHYDQARITRRLDCKPDWARFSGRSIARYGEIEQAGGQAFFHPVGAMIAGPETGEGAWLINGARKVAADQDIPFEDLKGEALQEQFPFFDFPQGVVGLYETGTGGWINPRELVAAEISAASASGADVYRDAVVDVDYSADSVSVTCSDGARFEGGRIVVACGPFSKMEGLLVEPIPMTVYARTIAFLEIGEEEATRLKTMPSLIYMPPDLSYEPYILPPVRYPDGKMYLKIGGDPVDIQLETVAEMKDWFRGPGNSDVATFLADKLMALMPGLACRSVTHASCATSFTPSGGPLIYTQSDQCVVLTAGNGAAAKCGDELGRLGALVATGQDILGEGYECDFKS